MPLPVIVQASGTVTAALAVDDSAEVVLDNKTTPLSRVMVNNASMLLFMSLLYHVYV